MTVSVEADPKQLRNFLMLPFQLFELNLEGEQSTRSGYPSIDINLTGREQSRTYYLKPFTSLLPEGNHSPRGTFSLCEISI